MLCDNCDALITKGAVVAMCLNSNKFPECKKRQWFFAFCKECNKPEIRNKVLKEAERKVTEWAKTQPKL